jgi:methyl-accepting chemotaxis protein
MSVTIGRQVLAGFAACLVALLLMALVATAALQQVASAKDEVIDERAPRVAQAHELEAIFASKAVAGRGFLLTGRTSHLETLGELDGALEKQLAQLQQEVTGAGSDLLSEVATQDDDWDATLESLVSERRTSGRVDVVADRAESELFPAYAAVRAALDTFVGGEEAAIDAGVAASDRSKSRALVTLWVIAGLTLAVAVVLAGWITRRISRQLTELARTVDTSAHEILAVVSQQVAGATEQAAAVQQTVATVDELVQTAEQAVERAQSVAARAQESVEVASVGTQALDDSTSGMAQVREQVDGIARSILELTQRAQLIGEIVGTVEGIADETHMLALNAAIEAARAGEQGRGFSVVAGEVKNLADQSRSATAKVSRILAEIQQGTTAAVMATEEGTKSTQAGTELVAEAARTIQELAATISAAAIAAEQIAASSRLQAAATVQISQAMRNVDTVMEQNVSSARQSEQTARGLTDAAAQMKSLVGAE